MSLLDLEWWILATTYVYWHNKIFCFVEFWIFDFFTILDDFSSFFGGGIRRLYSKKNSKFRQILCFLSAMQFFCGEMSYFEHI